MKTHNTNSSFKTQLQRETLASEKLDINKSHNSLINANHTSKTYIHNYEYVVCKTFIQVIFENKTTLAPFSHIFDRTLFPPANNTVHILTRNSDPDQLPHTINQNTPIPRGWDELKISSSLFGRSVGQISFLCTGNDFDLLRSLL